MTFFFSFNNFSSSRGHSPCRSPLLCPSPDSTEGRTTPKFYISKLCTANTNSSSSQSSSLSAAPSPNSSSAMEIPIDIPSLCAKAVNSDLNSDLDSSDVDCDSDSQKLSAPDHDVMQNRDEACEKMKKLFFARVSTDSTETDCSIEFKSQTTTSESNSHLSDNKTDVTMECDSSKKPDGFYIVQNLVSSTDDIEVAKENDSDGDHKTIELITKCVPNNDCVSVSVTNVTLGTDSTETST